MKLLDKVKYVKKYLQKKKIINIVIVKPIDPSIRSGFKTIMIL